MSINNVIWVLPGSKDSKVNMIFAKRAMPEMERQGCTVTPFYLGSRTHPLKLIKAAKELRREIQQTKAQLVHAQYGSVTSLFCVLASSVPVIVHFRGSDLNPDPKKSWAANFATFLLSQLSSLLASGSVFVSKNLLNTLWIKPKKSLILPSPIDLDVFRPMDKNECKQTLNLSLEKKYIAFVSSSDRAVKRLDLAQEAVSLVQKSRPEYELLVIQNIEPELVPIYLNSCELLLMTSLYEGSPNCVREAMACGLPVVSVDVGDVAFWVGLDSSSRIVGERAEDLAEGIAIAQNGSVVNLLEYNLESYSRKIISLYCEC